MYAVKNASSMNDFSQRYLNGKTWNGIMLRTQPLFCCYGQIGYQVFVYDREQYAATFTYDWEKQQTEISIN